MSALFIGNFDKRYEKKRSLPKPENQILNGLQYITNQFWAVGWARL